MHLSVQEFIDEIFLSYYGLKMYTVHIYVCIVHLMNSTHLLDLYSHSIQSLLKRCAG